MDIQLWMKAVQIDAYFDHFISYGVKKGADLFYIGDTDLQVQYSIVQYSIVQYSMAQYSVYSMMQYCTFWYSR